MGIHAAASPIPTPDPLADLQARLDAVEARLAALEARDSHQDALLLPSDRQRIAQGLSPHHPGPPDGRDDGTDNGQ